MFVQIALVITALHSLQETLRTQAHFSLLRIMLPDRNESTYQVLSPFWCSGDRRKKQCKYIILYQSILLLLKPCFHDYLFDFPPPFYPSARGGIVIIMPVKITK